MKSGWKVYWSYWLLLLLTLLLFINASPILPEGWERLSLPEVVEPEPPPQPYEIITIRVPTPIKQRDQIQKQDSIIGDTSAAPERILLIGDSMIEWLCRRLASWCKVQGYKLYTVIWPSSGLVWWGRTDTLRSFIEAYKPTYVLVSLGSNELLVPNPKRFAPYLERIIEQVGEIPMVWIGPPAWTKDKGIIDFLKRRLGPGRYLASERLVMERLSDGAHPTPKEAYRWADTLVVYLRDSALYPLPFPQEPPPGKTTTPHRTHLLSPHAP